MKKTNPDIKGPRKNVTFFETFFLFSSMWSFMARVHIYLRNQQPHPRVLSIFYKRKNAQRTDLKESSELIDVGIYLGTYIFAIVDKRFTSVLSLLRHDFFLTLGTSAQLGKKGTL